MERKKELEIINDSFYLKKKDEFQSCQFAYLHLSEDPHEIFLAYFENREVSDPFIYWWEENDYLINEKSRHFINEFISEAYLSLYIKEGKEKPIDKPLWRHPQCLNYDIPSKWWDIVQNIKR